MNRKGFGLVEVLIALAVLAVGFFPLYTTLTTVRTEAIDAAEFLSLLDRLQESVAEAAAEREHPAGTLTVEEGPRALLLTQHRVHDRFAALAPVVAGNEAVMKP